MENSKSKRNIKPFDGEKYSVWKFRVRALLNELNLLKVIDEVPNEESSSWRKAERVAKSIIIEYLSDSMLGFANTEQTAQQIFRKLDSVYERKSLATQLALRKKLLGLKLQGDTTLMSHFTVFDTIITELLAAGAKLEETDKVSHLFLTLPATYDGVITAIETLTENSLTLAFVKTRLLDQEVKLKSDASDTSAKVLQTNQESHTTNFNKNNFKNKSGFKNKNNSQNNNKFKKNNNNNNNNQDPNVECYFCGRIEHKQSECVYKKKRQQFVNKKYKNKRKSAQQIQMEESEPNIFCKYFKFCFYGQ